MNREKPTVRFGNNLWLYKLLDKEKLGNIKRRVDTAIHLLFTSFWIQFYCPHLKAEWCLSRTYSLIECYIYLDHNDCGLFALKLTRASSQITHRHQGERGKECLFTGPQTLQHHLVFQTSAGLAATLGKNFWNQLYRRGQISIIQRLSCF